MKNYGKESRHYFEMVYRNCGLEFKGRIEKKNHRNICFERIYVSGMYMDGVCFDDKEEHLIAANGDHILNLSVVSTIATFPTVDPDLTKYTSCNCGLSSVTGSIRKSKTLRCSHLYCKIHNISNNFFKHLKL